MDGRTLKAATAAALILMGTGAVSTATRTSAHPLSASRLCAMSDVSITVSWHKVGTGLPGGGGLEGRMRFAKKGSGTCTLRGWPGVRLFDAQGVRVPVHERHLPPLPGGVQAVVLTSMASPNKRATASISWLNWCKGTLRLPLSIGIRLPQRATFHHFQFVSGARLVTSCVNPTATSVVDVGPIIPSR
jgi:uncharacterized protein DUF4232